MLVLNTKGVRHASGGWGMASVTPPPARPAADCGERMSIGGPRPPACKPDHCRTFQRITQQATVTQVSWTEIQMNENKSREVGRMDEGHMWTREGGKEIT